MSPRALKACAEPGCAGLTRGSYCDEHERKPWPRSARRSQLSGWAQQKRARRILRTDDTCYLCGLAGADQVDHVVPLAEGGADDVTNLRPVHSRPCHAEKSARESAAARARARGAA